MIISKKESRVLLAQIFYSKEQGMDDDWMEVYLIEQIERLSKLRQVAVSGQLPLDFVKWYSGMEQEKILKAYERWIKESGNLR